MKIMAFILAIMALASHDVSATSNTDTMLGSDITVETERQGDTNVMRIRVRGEHQFDVTVESQTRRYTPSHITTDGEHFVLAGFAIQTDGDTRRYVAFIHVYDTEGKAVYTWYTEENHQEVRGVFLLHDTLIFQVDEHVEMDERRTLSLQATHFMIIDFATGAMRSTSFNEALPHVERCDTLLCLYYYDTYPPRYGLDAELNVLTADAVYGITPHATYTREVEGFVLNPGLLNDELVHGAFSVAYPGHYELHYAGKILPFTVEPIIEGIEAGDVVAPGVMVVVMEGYVRLNGQPFTSGETIEAPGHHELTVEGLGGYKKTLNFTVTSNLKGIYDGNRYDTPQTLTFNGTGFLNGRLVESGVVVDEQGHYTLEIFGVNDYRETHAFDIEMQESNTNREMIILEVGLFAVGTVLIAGGVWWSWRKKTC